LTKEKIIDHKDVNETKDDIQEVLNAIEAYNKIAEFDPNSVKPF